MSLAQQTTRGTLWTSAATYGSKGLVFVTTIILARFLTEEAFGLVALALFVIAFLEVLQDLGIGAAVIYAPSEEPANTAFWLNLAIALLLWGLTALAAPYIASFFDEPQAIPVLRVLGASFPLFALRNIHDALLRKRLAFDKRFWPEMANTVGRGAISIVLALLGFEAWSLIWGQLGGSALAALAYWRAIEWRPSFKWKGAHVRPLLQYGGAIVVVNGLAVALAQVDYMLVQRYMKTEALGVYSVAFRIPDFLLMQFCVVIANVIFPVYMRMRDEPGALRQGFLATTRYVALVTVPLGLGMALVAEPFVLALFEENWVEAIPVMQAIAIYALFLSLGFNAGDVYKAQGRASLLSWLSLIRLCVLAPALWWAAAKLQSLTAVGWTHAAVAAFGCVLNLGVAAHMNAISWRELWDAVRPSFGAGALMAVAVGLALQGLTWAPPLLQLVLAVAVGIASYGLALWLLDRPLVLLARRSLLQAFERRTA